MRIQAVDSRDVQGATSLRAVRVYVMAGRARLADRARDRLRELRAQPLGSSEASLSDEPFDNQGMVINCCGSDGDYRDPSHRECCIACDYAWRRGNGELWWQRIFRSRRG